MSKSLYTLADLSRMTNAMHRFGTIKTASDSRAVAQIKTASGEFETPALSVINRPLGASEGEACMLIAPQGNPAQGVLVALHSDQQLVLKIADLEQRLLALEQI